MDRQSGFTLIELMLVILIMGIVTTWIVASLPSGATSAPAQRLALAATAALRQAHTLQVPVRLTLSAHSWCISRFKFRADDRTVRIHSQWKNVKDQCEILPEDMRLILDNAEISSEKHIYFLPSGPIIPLPVVMTEQNRPVWRIAMTEDSYVAELYQ